jgi:membrane-bound serine protease (ClpP class)
MREKPDYRGLLGKVAVADTPLSPAGQAIIEGRVYPVSTEGAFVDAGRGLRVTKVKGKRIIVTLV